MKNVIVTFLLLILLPNLSLAYPIEPRPLRKLVMESEYIVVGHVLETRSAKQKDNSWDRVIAKIKVIEVLQGSITEEIIEVPYPAGLICPAPPHYQKGTSVLAFLTKADGKYRTHALSYGSKTLSLPEIAIYKSRIQEMQQIVKIADPDTKFMETIEWLVKCTEHEATRWEGTFELSPESDFMSYYSRSEHELFRYLLSEDQRQRLRTALLETNDPHYYDFGLVDLVYPFHEAEVRSFLLKGLKDLNDQQLWFADEFMTRLAYGKQSEEMDTLIKRFSKKQFERDADKELKKLVSDFIVLAEK